MPCYEFQCKKCDSVYDDVVPYDETGKYKKVKCPGCGSKSKTQLMTTCNFAFAQPEGTSRWLSNSTGHDYRFKHKQKDVQAERAAAEAASSSGAMPYNPINDLNSDASWGEVE